MPAPILEVSGVSKKFCRNPHRSLRYFLDDVVREIMRRPPAARLRTDEFWAVQDVGFDLARGEVLGVIGRNGAGKSTLINLVAGVVRPTAGQMIIGTRRVALMDHGGGLNPALTGRENIRKMLSLHGCPGKMVPAKEEAAIEFAEIGSFIDAAVGTYSLGMRQRLAFSIYTQLEPDLFIADEALNGGDLRFRRKFANFLKDYIAKGGSILLCSHDLYTIQTLCPRSILLEHGRMVAAGDTMDVLDAYHRLQAEQAQVKTPVVASPREPAKSTPGLDDIRIDSVTVQGAKGGEISPGQPLEIELRCLAEHARENLLCAVEIGNEFHASLSTLVFGYPPEILRLGIGANTLRCRLESLPLAAGRYHVRAYITDKETAVTLAAYEGTLGFSVAKASDAVVSIASYRNNIVHMRGDWSVTTHEP